MWFKWQCNPVSFLLSVICQFIVCCEIFFIPIIHILYFSLDWEIQLCPLCWKKGHVEKSHTHLIYSEYQAKSLILNKQIYKWLFSAKLTGGWADHKLKTESITKIKVDADTGEWGHCFLSSSWKKNPTLKRNIQSLAWHKSHSNLGWSCKAPSCVRGKHLQDLFRPRWN